MYVRQFDWGGRLQRVTEACEGKLNVDRKPTEERNGICLPDCKIYRSSRDESRS